MPRRLSVVVPAVDEAPTLRQRFGDLLALGDELVVSDGGSRDDTVALARAAGARIVEGPPGRGGQLRRGAAAATGDILLFLHADVRLPAGSGEAIRAAVDAGAVSGAFALRFEPSTPLLRLGERLVNWRTRRFLVPLGDQAQFVRRDLFKRIGGFPDWPILEDLDLTLRLRRIPGMVILPGPAVVSSRRFLVRGTWRTVAVDWLIWSLFLCGVSPHRLALLYRQVR
ncbi:MAG: TIGR04283 family arsenosugar biosynthesis glycosyltransferase [Holophagales bacterium]|nr:MAG: TIGR04283 family arsenosugar biosynthesis glycosyltransferase [Holophagales bacterium]